MTIVKWAKEFLREGELSDHSQGVHSKRESFINDSDVKAMVPEEIRMTKPAERSLICIGNNSQQVPVRGGYAYRKNKKMIYFDGHERKDVVAYRILWSKRMMDHIQKMDFYSGEQEEVVLEPVLEEDESTLYANDGKNDLWLMEDENHIRKKDPGASIMVSEFQCPCHGTMKIQG
ncbi:hypothetical protein MUCCIDRAFT_107063 [Mucor lusitanicus CBS 277.49]|uniref:Uncharacterized protein n=1 Tax=Mucor lusitanicus CBS 277.49 TaxID=747725 RepID=A0A168NMP1_MUCCL|nr:hypothetical protein MUCCIDRAFT_107063 [Mucor lusitanicus CBS 277.49]